MIDIQQLPAQSRNQESFQSGSFQQEENITPSKQTLKKQTFTFYKVIVGIIIFLILILGAYQVYSISSSKTIDQINNAHNKYIQNGDSSSGKDSGSVSGSQESKGSKGSDKPGKVAKPAGKGTISSNVNTNGQGRGDDDEEDSNEENRRKKLVDKNKETDSTDESDDSVEEDSEEEDQQNLTWNPAKQGQAMPNSVGGIRD